MDARTLLESLLASGRELVGQGCDVAETTLGVPKTAGENRDAMISGLGKGAAVGGVLALLLGTHRGRRLAGSAVKLGSLAAVGGIAYTAFTQWQNSAGEPTDFGTSIENLAGDEADQRSTAMIRAMISAANADGHIDATEVAAIRKQVASLGLDEALTRLVDAEIERPLDAKEVARLADSPAAAAEMYLTSLLVIDVDTASERAYLDELAGYLKLPTSLVAELEAEGV